MSKMLYGAYLFWKHSFFGISKETDDSETLYNTVWAIVFFSLFTCLDFCLLYVILFKKNEYTSSMFAGYENVGTLINFVIPLLIFLLLFSNKHKYIHYFRSVEDNRTKKYLSLSFWTIYMIIPIVVLILIP